MKKFTKKKISTPHSDAKLVKEVERLASSERSLELELAKEIKELTREITRMKDMEVIQIFKNKWRFLGMSLLKGIAVGFGSVLGATVFIYIFIHLLAQMSVVPVIGDFVNDIINQINGTTSSIQSTTKQTFTEKFQEAQQQSAAKTN